MTLYNPKLEKDNCGFGLIAHIEGETSHKLVRTAISALDRMTHRGGIAADGKTGDGCGLLMKKPEGYYRIVAEEAGWKLAREFAVGMIFLSQDPVRAEQARTIINEELGKETLSLAGWRDVPINAKVLGPIATESLPLIEQVFVNAPAGWKAQDMQRLAVAGCEQVADGARQITISQLESAHVDLLHRCRDARPTSCSDSVCRSKPLTR